MTELRLLVADDLVKALRPEEVDAKVWAELVATRPVDQDPRLPVTPAEMERFAASRLGRAKTGQA
jgi:hypothetical protein